MFYDPRPELARINRRLDTMEQLLVLIAQQVGVDPRQVQRSSEAGVSDEVRHLAASGQKIQAIKRLREQTGLGLKEAKDTVDRL